LPDTVTWSLSVGVLTLLKAPDVMGMLAALVSEYSPDADRLFIVMP
jgi:hypothetical protein